MTYHLRSLAKDSRRSNVLLALPSLFYTIASSTRILPFGTTA
jgi:hypothetical protein